MHFNHNDLKVLEHQNHVQRKWKGDFLTQNNLGRLTILGWEMARMQK